jgi:hypothetical protein
MYGEGNPRAGYEPRPVEMVRVERGADLVKDFTTTRCDRYCAEVRADELDYSRSANRSRYGREMDN